ncbi:MAG: SUKH-3 domain-containing protein [Oscillospiraceae bacterium]|nr:SUKH-3 domain-containing protein [Oscillospiraceae bacterium]
MLIEKAKQQLEKAGWYEGRKIDITEQEKFLEDLGYEVFDAAKRFMEEYGELEIYDRYLGYENTIFEHHHTTCIKRILLDNEKFDLDKEVGKKTIPVLIRSGEVCVFISEDEKFYVYMGLMCENSDELWNDYYGDVAHFVLTWKEIAEGKPLRKNFSPPQRGREYL